MKAIEGHMEVQENKEQDIVERIKKNITQRGG